MWQAFIDLITNILTLIHDVCGDWGLAIIILTLIVRILIMPLMTRSTRSSAKMQVLQPKLQEIQERYADNPEQLQKEMSKFYAENDFNPMCGCLPIILQMPIFFALFAVLRNIGTISQGHASFFNIVPDLAKSAADLLPEHPQIIPGVVQVFINPDTRTTGAIYVFLVLLFGLLTLIPLLLNTAGTSDPQQVKTSRMMGIFMSVWMVWIGWGLPSGVLLYYNTSAIWQVAQQRLITNRVMAEAKAEAEAAIKDRPVEVNVVRQERKKRPHKKG